MKLYISNQHGAIVMALLPFFYGMFTGTPVWLHLFLLLAWFSLYLFTYPFFNLLQNRRREINRRWCLCYVFAAFIFALPALWYNWHIILFVIAMMPFGLVNIYYVKQKNERALGNDIAAIIIFAIAGMVAYYFTNRTFDVQMARVFIYPSLFFIGTTLYVKSIMRERKKPVYLYASMGYHFALVTLLSFINWQTALCFLPALLRAVIVPRHRLNIKQVGLLETGIATLFLVGLCLVSN